MLRGLTSATLYPGISMQLKLGPGKEGLAGINSYISLYNIGYNCIHLIAGVHSRTLYRMRDEGYITQLERGIFMLNDGIPSTNPDLAVVATRLPSAIICLISALDFHGMTTEIPHYVHIALSRKQRNPKLSYLPVKVYRFSGKSLTEGIDRHEIDGIHINVFNPAKTIADCFKFRNQIGLDIPIEALKNGVREKKVTYKEILKYAKICRVEKAMKPYLETITYG